MLKTSEFTEYVVHDCEIISERVRGLMTAENADLEAKFGLASIAAEYRERLMAFEHAVFERGSPTRTLNMIDLEVDPQAVAA